MKTVTLDVQGMTCGGCVASVTRLLNGIAGVQSAQVSLDKAQAEVQFDEAQTAPASLVAAIENGGFDAAVR